MSGREHSDLIIRLDAGPSIGSGHFMRCLAYAAAAEGLGLRSAFAVSDAESAAFAGSRGREAVILEGNKRAFREDDGRVLAEYASEVGAGTIIVDSYAVSEPFFAELRRGYAGAVAYVDDLYLFSSGRLEKPVPWDVTHVVNYSFAASLEEYVGIYGHSDGLLIGPSYAPIRPEFVGKGSTVGKSVSRVLVTSGATNPERFLECATSICLRALPLVDVDVLVGAMAEVTGNLASNSRVRLHRNVSAVSELMKKADIAISAAGSTLYELACMGVPTIAIPIVKNQEENAQGFHDLGIGLSLENPSTIEDTLSECLRELVTNNELRRHFAKKAVTVVDGFGAVRVIHALIA